MAVVEQSVTTACAMCGDHDLDVLFSYHEPPAGETIFAFSNASYRRLVKRCGTCGHMMSLHDMDDSGIYSGNYVDATYGDKLRATFQRIIDLPPSQSDNVGRCRRLDDFARSHFHPRDLAANPPRVLDVGSGLCVFLHRMKEHGWDGVALDPDPRAAEHAREVVGVDAVCADFFDFDDPSPFDVITLNKVLEHVQEPIAMLAKCRSFVRDGGMVYIELPDGEQAQSAGQVREEFFIEHHHIFSLASVAILVSRAGLVIQSTERLIEPSGKYTLCVFCTHPSN